MFDVVNFAALALATAIAPIDGATATDLERPPQVEAIMTQAADPPNPLNDLTISLDIGPVTMSGLSEAAAELAIDVPRLALNDAQLAEVRGGFMTPLGVDIGFGAVVRTTIDGVLALETRMSWTANGAETTNAAGAPTDPAQVNDLATAGGINLGPASGWRGIVSPGDGGATAALHDLSQNSISSLIVNTASNRNIRQETEITLNIPEFADLQSGIMAEQAGLRMQDAVGAAITNALPN